MLVNCPFCGNKIEETDKQGLKEEYCQNCKKFHIVKVFLASKSYIEKEKEDRLRRGQKVVYSRFKNNGGENVWCKNYIQLPSPVSLRLESIISNLN